MFISDANTIATRMQLSQEWKKTLENFCEQYHSKKNIKCMYMGLIYIACDILYKFIA